MQNLLQKIYRQQNLSKQEMRQLADHIFQGSLSEAELGALLVALKIKGETIEEITAIAEAMQQVAQSVPVKAQGVMDNCGTGGDRSGSFNISTTAAFVLAANGIPIAKHGNRSISSKSGSADVLAELGVEIIQTEAELARVLDEVGIAFLFAPAVHPNMKYVMPVRQRLATPTVFNLIGPLTNPVPLEVQLMGIYRAELLEQIAYVLQNLGRKKAVVVHGAGGLDEATLAGTNHYAWLHQDRVTLHQFGPEDVGLKYAPLEAIRGGDAKTNALILKQVLKGEPSAYFDTTLLNAGMGLFAYGCTDTIEKGVQLAREIILSGAAYAKLQELIEKQKEVVTG
ncbi:anthranilate phosphoribosyltransferase [Listeria ilorinensis]|uniref:anthranilate phosphoribosyltransferase n=1 Tax=Listeria ilorinensis TaxID=2867439 RepID=UPI001EF46879|nr:anthranilate phosphoribosyltransferase [Listeria ilorinensis]